jgi:hypothetical protein
MVWWLWHRPAMVCCLLSGFTRPPGGFDQRIAVGVVASRVICAPRSVASCSFTSFGGGGILGRSTVCRTSISPVLVHPAWFPHLPSGSVAAEAGAAFSCRNARAASMVITTRPAKMAMSARLMSN